MDALDKVDDIQKACLFETDNIWNNETNLDLTKTWAIIDTKLNNCAGIKPSLAPIPDSLKMLLNQTQQKSFIPSN